MGMSCKTPKVSSPLFARLGVVEYRCSWFRPWFVVIDELEKIPDVFTSDSMRIGDSVELLLLRRSLLAENIKLV